MGSERWDCSIGASRTSVNSRLDTCQFNMPLDNARGNPEQGFLSPGTPFNISNR